MSKNQSQIDEPIFEAFENMACEYKKSMSQFRPCKIGGEMSESNLVFTFLREFLKNKPDAIYAVEVPFANIKDDKDTPTNIDGDSWTKHLDALIYHDQVLYLIEAKRDYPAKTYFELIEKDLKRIKSQALAFSLNRMINRDDDPKVEHKAYDKPIQTSEIKAVKGILLADTWRELNVKVWEEGKRDNAPFNWLQPLHRKTKSLGFQAKNPKAPYTLLIAQTENLSDSLKIIKKGIQI